MRYFLAIVCPPLAVLSCGKFFASLFNCFLTLFFWVPGMIHALLVVREYSEEGRSSRVLKTMKYQNDLMALQLQTVQLQAMSTMTYQAADLRHKRISSVAAQKPRHLRRRKKLA